MRHRTADADAGEVVGAEGGQRGWVIAVQTRTRQGILGRAQRSRRADLGAGRPSLAVGARLAIRSDGAALDIQHRLPGDRAAGMPVDDLGQPASRHQGVDLLLAGRVQVVELWHRARRRSVDTVVDADHLAGVGPSAVDDRGCRIGIGRGLPELFALARSGRHRVFERRSDRADAGSRDDGSGRQRCGPGQREAVDRRGHAEHQAGGGDDHQTTQPAQHPSTVRLATASWRKVSEVRVSGDGGKAPPVVGRRHPDHPLEVVPQQGRRAEPATDRDRVQAQVGLLEQRPGRQHPLSGQP